MSARNKFLLLSAVLLMMFLSRGNTQTGKERSESLVRGVKELLPWTPSVGHAQAKHMSLTFVETADVLNERIARLKRRYGSKMTQFDSDSLYTLQGNLRILAEPIRNALQSSTALYPGESNERLMQKLLQEFSHIESRCINNYGEASAVTSRPESRGTNSFNQGRPPRQDAPDWMLR